jgi:transcriptional regulator with XRE-family HTH domain
MNSTSQQEIISTIRQHRINQDLTQADIAKRMGTNVSYIQAIEYRSAVDRRWGTLLKYAEAVGCVLEVEVIR